MGVGRKDLDLGVRAFRLGRLFRLLEGKDHAFRVGERSLRIRPASVQIGTSGTLALFVVGALTRGTHGCAPRNNVIGMCTQRRRSCIRVSMRSGNYKLSPRSMTHVIKRGMCSSGTVNVDSTPSGRRLEGGGKDNFKLVGYGNVVRGCHGAGSLFGIYLFGIRDKLKGNDHFCFHLPTNVHGSISILLIILSLYVSSYQRTIRRPTSKRILPSSLTLLTRGRCRTLLSRTSSCTGRTCCYGMSKRCRLTLRCVSSTVCYLGRRCGRCTRPVRHCVALAKSKTPTRLS